MTKTDAGRPRGRGRPSTGSKVEVRIPADLLAQVDAAARSRGVTRSDYLRQLIALSLTPPVARRRP